jgi:hypothetical protein
MKRALLLVLALAVVLPVAEAYASIPGSDARLTNDYPAGGYVSSYTLATGAPYTDEVLEECSIARGRQNEPSVAVNPRDTRVLIGSSNDYCGVYVGTDEDGNPVPTGPIWLGYYRSEDRGESFVSSLVPGYPGDTSPYAALSKARTASSGDPVIAWDNHGRVFMGAESSDDPAGSPKTFGDVWVARYKNPAGPAGATINDGKKYGGTSIVARGSSAPFLLGKFNDKTAIEADRTSGGCDGNVYFSWSRFTGGSPTGFTASVYFARSTNHGRTFSHPKKVSQSIHDIQFPDIAVTGNGHVYVTFRQFRSVLGGERFDGIFYVKSTNCGRTFSRPRLITKFEPYDATDLYDDGSLAGDCGDLDSHCQSGYTFFRRSTQVRSTADQLDDAHEWIYIVYDPSKPGTEVATGTSYGSVISGDLPVKFHRRTGSQSGTYFLRLNGATRTHTTPELIDDETVGHQLFPDISADGGTLHAIWWDSRFDPAYSPRRPVGNDAAGNTYASLDVFGSSSNDHGDNWSTAARVTDVTSNPNYEQFADRTVPFAGDYLWVTSLEGFAYTAWTDYRDVVQGPDPREAGEEDEDAESADVVQCRVFDPATETWSGDRCPHAGGLDQNIYGDLTP